MSFSLQDVLEQLLPGTLIELLYEKFQSIVKMISINMRVMTFIRLFR